MLDVMKKDKIDKLLTIECHEYRLSVRATTKDELVITGNGQTQNVVIVFSLHFSRVPSIAVLIKQTQTDG